MLLSRVPRLNGNPHTQFDIKWQRPSCSNAQQTAFSTVLWKKHNIGDPPTRNSTSDTKCQPPIQLKFNNGIPKYTLEARIKQNRRQAPLCLTIRPQTRGDLSPALVYDSLPCYPEKSRITQSGPMPIVYQNICKT